MQYRAGIVGCGRIGSELDDDPRRKVVSTHAGAYRAVDEVELVAACDLIKEKLEKCGKRWQIASLYDDYGEMLRKEALDILSICTWNSTHLAVVREAVTNGVKAILCEKPIADSLKNTGRTTFPDSSIESASFLSLSSLAIASLMAFFNNSPFSPA